MNTIIAVLSVADMRNWQIYFLDQGTQESTREKATYMMFLDLLYRIESEHKYFTESGIVSWQTWVNFQQQFGTLTPYLHPPLIYTSQILNLLNTHHLSVFDNHLMVYFDSSTDWPLASTCVLQLTLPTKFHDNFEKFRDNVVFGLLNHGGFGLLWTMHATIAVRTWCYMVVNLSTLY